MSRGPAGREDLRRRAAIVRWIGCLVLAWTILATTGVADDSASSPGSEPPTFAEQVDLDPLGTSAVLIEGRLKSLGSHAASTMHLITGPRSIGGQSELFTYLDMIIRPEEYARADVIYVKNKEVRRRIADAAVAADASRAERLEVSRRTGLFSPDVLGRPEVEKVLQVLEADLVRTARPVGEIRGALFLSNPRILLERLRLLPDAVPDAPWIGLDEVVLPEVKEVGGAVTGDGDGRVPAESASAIRAAWMQLLDGWQAGDVAATNSAVVALASAVRTVRPEAHPDESRLRWEHWYFEWDNLTSIWLVYLASVIVLMVAVVYRWPWAMRIGLGVFVAALALQTFAVGLRWYVAARWPNSNMFEAVTTASWFGAVAAILFEAWVRRTPLRGFFALGAAVSCMVALMSAHFLPVYLNPNISNMMPVLHDVWLYIHTNVIIFSYALIFMAAVSSAAYLAWRLAGNGPAYARVGGAGQAFAPATSLGETLDGVTMLLTEVSFVMLWAGIVMGAIWADHSWGRPWGWDPKEVFALNTFIVFALLIHVRWKVRDKGMWTAVLAVAGAAVMLFNWIVINFVISGLHSYA